MFIKIKKIYSLISYNLFEHFGQYMKSSSVVYPQFVQIFKLSSICPKSISSILRFTSSPFSILLPISESILATSFTATCFYVILFIPFYYWYEEKHKIPISHIHFYIRVFTTTFTYV